jgi:hypothetical protein
MTSEYRNSRLWVPPVEEEGSKLIRSDWQFLQLWGLDCQSVCHSLHVGVRRDPVAEFSFSEASAVSELIDGDTFNSKNLTLFCIHTNSFFLVMESLGWKTG